MQLISVNCPNCGAPVKIPEAARYVKCTHCCASLEVSREGNAFNVDLIERIEGLEYQIETLRLQNELERVEREWMMKRELHLVRQKNGRLVEPDATRAIVGGLALVAFGVLWIHVAISIAASARGCLPGILLILIAVGLVSASAWRIRKYTAALTAYKTQRQELRNQIQGCEERSR
ncbi:MAG: hypothetical protein GY842_24895 [bacterium]|nr:hypothetical protein [bacterium]